MAKKNIFLAMGLEPEDAAVQAIRADLADAIAQYFAGQPHAVAQEELGLPQATVSQVMNGKIGHVSIERLIRAMLRAGIPGCAQWPDADTACGGTLAVSHSSATLRTSVEMQEELHVIDQPFGFDDARGARKWPL
jgi:predicted XRE-type DNA-binding protein